MPDVLFEVAKRGADGKVKVEPTKPDAIFHDNSGREYPALIERIYSDVVCVKERGKYHNRDYPVADLRVAYGTFVVRNDERGMKSSQPEFRPVAGVPLKGTARNPDHDAWYLPTNASACCSTPAEDGGKTRDDLMHELEEARAELARARGVAKAKVDSKDQDVPAYEKLSYKELVDFAQAQGLAIPKGAGKETILAAIRKFEAV